MGETVGAFGATERWTYFGSQIAPSDHAPHEQEVELILRQWFAGDPAPTAIMTSFDSEAEMIYLMLNRMGLRVPLDVSLMGFGGTWRDGALNRLLTSVVVDEDEVGRRAVTLLEEIRHGTRPMEDAARIELPLSLSKGQTLGAATVHGRN